MVTTTSPKSVTSHISLLGHSGSNNNKYCHLSYPSSAADIDNAATPPLVTARAGGEEDDFGATQIIVTRWQWRCTQHIF